MQTAIRNARRATAGRPIADDAQAVIDLMKGGHTSVQIAEKLDVSIDRVKRIRAYIRELEDNAVEEVSEIAEAPEKEKKKPVRISKVEEIDADLPIGKVHRFILTSAQDDTPIFKPFWDNLQAYARCIGAEIGVGGYTYQLGLYEDHAVATASYAPELSNDLNFDRVRLTDNLLWIGDANILPTTSNPLSGWTTANRGQHVIVPHARVAFESIPRMQGQPPRFALSTGTVTEPSYTPRASGRKALFHHTYGALLVEIDVEGDVFFHQLLAAQDGSFQHLNVLVRDGEVHVGPRIRSITWGDIHFEQMNPQVAWTSWGYNMHSKAVETKHSIIDVLNPEYQFLHDTNDFRRRNHHGIKDPHQRAMVRATGSESVAQEIAEAAHFVNCVRRPGTRTVMVESNHDAALARWLKDPEGAMDAHNAYYWHHLNAIWHKAINDGDTAFNVVQEAMMEAGLAEDVEFVPSGGSYVVDDVECGLHGDLGVGGSRGTPQQYRRLGPKTSSGHTHTPKIVEGVYVAGVSANLDQGYNKGPTTWAHAHIVQYQNGKRALIILSEDGRISAEGDRRELESIAA